MKVSQNNLRSITAASLALFATLAFASEAGAKVLAGQVCSARVHALTEEIDWKKNLKDAENTAAAENKLIVWVHMLGKIDGAT